MVKGGWNGWFGEAGIGGEAVIPFFLHENQFLSKKGVSLSRQIAISPF